MCPAGEGGLASVAAAGMADMRNVVIQEYFGVDPGNLWETLQQELPPLIPQMQEILA